MTMKVGKAETIKWVHYFVRANLYKIKQK